MVFEVACPTRLPSCRSPKSCWLAWKHHHSSRRLRSRNLPKKCSCCCHTLNFDCRLWYSLSLIFHSENQGQHCYRPLVVCWPLWVGQPPGLFDSWSFWDFHKEFHMCFGDLTTNCLEQPAPCIEYSGRLVATDNRWGRRIFPAVGLKCQTGQEYYAFPFRIYFLNKEKCDSSHL